MSSEEPTGKGEFFMSDIEKARDMQIFARKDFDALRGMGDNPLFSDEIYGFHAQQAIEKSLKAWIASKSLEFPLTHDLKRLLLVLQQTGESVDCFLPLIRYTIFSVLARYENGILDTEEGFDRKEILEEVRQLLVHVEAKISVAS